LAILYTVTSLLGVGLIYSMAKVYQLRTMPSWNTWRTMAGFFITALLLGQLLMLNILAVESKLTRISVSSNLSWGIVVVLLMGELGLILSAIENAHWTVNRLRVGLIAGAMIGVGTMFVLLNLFGMWASFPILIVVLMEEIIGRRLFYEALNERVL
jgi:DMSO reductase anchor subunit